MRPIPKWAEARKGHLATVTILGDLTVFAYQVVFVTELQNALLFKDRSFIKMTIYLEFYLFNKCLTCISSVPVSLPGVGARGKH